MVKITSGKIIITSVLNQRGFFMKDKTETFTIVSKKQGAFTVIVVRDDLLRLEKLKNMKWTVSVDGDNLIYFLKNINGTVFRLHRWIMGVYDDMVVDHINRNTLDNRKKNLRVCSRATNCRNRGPGKNNTSGYNGVSFKKSHNRWESYICVNKKRIYLGYFKDKDSAVQSRQKAFIKYFND